MGLLLRVEADDSVRFHRLRLVSRRNHANIDFSRLWKSLILWINKLGTLRVILDEPNHCLVTLRRELFLDLIRVGTIDETYTGLKQLLFGGHDLRLNVISKVGEEPSSRNEFDVQGLVVKCEPFSLLPLLIPTINLLLQTFSISLLT